MGNSVQALYKIGQAGIQIAFNEVEEIILWHINAVSYREAVIEMNEFLNYVRENNFEFDVPDVE